jgi:hypothetical protein
MKTYINLLPQSYRRRRLVGERLLLWSAVWGLAAAIACAAFALEYRQYNSRLATLGARQREYAPILKMREERAGLLERIDELEAREALVLNLADEQPVLAVLGIVSRAARRCEGEICVQQFSLTRQWSARGAPGGANSGPRASRLLTLKGYALDHPSVLSFVDRLRSENAFEGVELKSSESAPAPRGAPARVYFVECVF